jgi:hypothetical protein
VIIVDRAIWEHRGRRWAHLTSDESFDELHEFAAALGLPPRAFHRDHYDLPDELYERALTHGAHQVSSRELVRRLKAAGLRRRKTRELGGEVGTG